VIVCVAANPSIDKLFEVERLIEGAIHRPVGFVQVAGGKGLNAARAAHSLGAEVQVAAILRGHAGIGSGDVPCYAKAHGEQARLTRGRAAVRARLGRALPDPRGWWHGTRRVAAFRRSRGSTLSVCTVPRA
jgi:hypothetical protein